MNELTLQESIELFLGEYRETTRLSYHYDLIDFTNYIGVDRPLTDIDERDVLRFNQHILKRDYAPATHKKKIKTLKTFMNWVHRVFRIWDQPPSKAVKSPRLRKAVDRKKAMTDEELFILLDIARYDERKYALVLFFADTGCRAGGVAGLKIEDIDFNLNEATVTEKGDKTRTVSFGDDCANALRAWLNIKPPESGYYVFRNNTCPVDEQGNMINTPITSSVASQTIRRLCKDGIRNSLPIRSLGSHSLRHRMGFQLAKARISPAIAALILGHDSPQTTIEYYYPLDWGEAKVVSQELAVQIPPKQVTMDESNNIIHFNNAKSG